MIDVATGRATKIETDAFNTPGRDLDAVWSPDSKWIAYSKALDSHLRAIFLYSLADGKPVQVTDGLADAISPAFDAGGKYLYFLASTDYGPRTGWVEMSAVDRPVRRSIYLAVLSASEPSPFLPEAGDEPVTSRRARSARHHGARRRRRSQSENPHARCPGGRLQQSHGRPGRVSLLHGAGGRRQRPSRSRRCGCSAMCSKTARRQRSSTPFGRTRSRATTRRCSIQPAAGDARWGIVPSDRPARVGDGAINVAQLETMVDPRAEWAEIFRESWRNQRDYFYDPKMHGADWQAVLAKYTPLLAYVNHRADLGYLVAQTGGELVVGHSYLAGAGDLPPDTPVAVGLLGAEYAVENGHYRIRRIFTGENWNPDLRAPLRAPGIQVAEGDYLLEVNGRPVAPPTNLYQFFEGTAGHQTVIRVNSTPSTEGSRLVTVVPTPSEEGLRTRAWIEDNRRKVDQLSGGKLAYVWLPNTSIPGYNAFTRYFYAQQEKDGAVIDERYNHGGLVADYIVNELDRKPMGYFAMRDGKSWTSPAAGIYGPKVMIINESAGSGGDALPYYFKLRKVGPLVGTRTWGGLVGTTGVPPTIDGGGITAPGLAFYDSNGRWSIENEGIAPDIEVENTAAEVIAGHDPQLERAVREALKLLEQNPVKRTPRPPPIDRASKPPSNHGVGPRASWGPGESS